MHKHRYTHKLAMFSSYNSYSFYLAIFCCPSCYCYIYALFHSDLAIQRANMPTVMSLLRLGLLSSSISLLSLLQERVSECDSEEHEAEDGGKQEVV